MIKFVTCGYWPPNKKNKLLQSYIFFFLRYSTLPFFTLLLTQTPSLVAEVGQEILESLLTLISSCDDGDVVHLKVDISSRKDQVVERLQVFTLINSILEEMKRSWDKKNAVPPPKLVSLVKMHSVTTVTSSKIIILVENAPGNNSQSS